jgi:hypothetical protein
MRIPGEVAAGRLEVAPRLAVRWSSGQVPHHGEQLPGAVNTLQGLGTTIFEDRVGPNDQAVYPFEESPPFVDGTYFVRWQVLGLASVLFPRVLGQDSFTVKDGRLVR